MDFSRRDLLSKCVALGVVKLGTGLTIATAIDSWLLAETVARSKTPVDQLGPFYKKGTPQSPGHTAVLRAPGDPGLQLLVAGAVYNTRGEALPMAKVDVWQTDHLGHYDITGYRYRALLRSFQDTGVYEGLSDFVITHYRQEWAVLLIGLLSRQFFRFRDWLIRDGERFLRT